MFEMRKSVLKDMSKNWPPKGPKQKPSLFERVNLRWIGDLSKKKKKKNCEGKKVKSHY